MINRRGLHLTAPFELHSSKLSRTAKSLLGLTGVWLIDQINALSIDLVSYSAQPPRHRQLPGRSPIVMVTAGELGWIDKADSHRLERAFQPWTI